MPWGIVIKADESAPLEFRLFDQLTEYQETVGGHIEAVDLWEELASFYVNEEGKNQGLEMNRRATLLWWVTTHNARNVDVITGDCILIGQPDEEGETQDVPSKWVKLLMKTDLYKYEVETLERDESWYGNARTFADYFDACNAALDLLRRWVLAQNVRVVAA
jgi:hypothetical protein